MRYTPAQAAWFRERDVYVNPDHIIEENSLNTNKGDFQGNLFINI